MKLLLLTEAEIRRCVSTDRDGLTAVANGFAALEAGDASMPPIMRVDVPEHNGEVDVKSAYVRGLDSFAVKLSSGFFDNHKLGLPSTNGLMVLVSARTGVPEALLLDNGYLTDVRTGLAGALAARHLAPERIRSVGVIGSGAQARYQVRALHLAREFERILVHSRTPQHAEQYAAEMRDEFGAAETADLRQVVEQSEVVITTTPAREPLIEASWLRPGQHITAMGSDSEHKGELQIDVLQRADILACDSREQCFRLGELRRGVEAGVITPRSHIVELGQLVSGKKPGRHNDDEITVCDLTGTGVQDTTIALLAFERAKALGQGTWIDA